MVDQREAVAALARTHGRSLAALSRMLGRNPAYLQQFVERGSPRRLAEADRRLLADHFGVSEALLGGPVAGDDTVAVPLRDVRASAGPGALAGDERVLGRERFAGATLRDLGIAPGLASIVTARGDSMWPVIIDGDRLLVDEGDRRLGRTAGIYVMRRDEALVVKRARQSGASVELVSDNPAYDTITLPLDEVTVIGRVKLLLRTPA